MMATETKYRLDRDKLSENTPEEQDGRASNVLPMFAVPSSMSVGVDSASLGIKSIEFAYKMKEEDGPSMSLDDLDTPIVSVSVSKFSRKVTKLAFANPIGEDKYRLIAARLRAKANDAESLPVGQRLSYRMTASIIDSFVAGIFKSGVIGPPERYVTPET